MERLLKNNSAEDFLMNRSILWCVVLLSFSSLVFSQEAKPGRPRTEATLFLREHWSLQSSGKVDEKGEVLSTPAFQPKNKDWYTVTVPTTVVAALIEHEVYPDPFLGMNLRSFPGVTYPIGANFSNIPMQPDSPFIVPWWYRKEFVLPGSFKGKSIWLNFGGINYRANIWLNGKQIAKSEDTAGAWRTYEFNITDTAVPGKANALAVQVFSPTDTDLAITFVDWNPAPPDKNMGLFRDVEISTSGPVALRYPAVLSKIDSPANDKAHLTVSALLRNGANHPVKGTLKGRIENADFSQEVELAPGESKDVTFAPEQFPQLNVDNPRLWWPAQMGKPELYSLSLEFNTDGKISDRSETKFGIREVKSEVLSANRRLFSVNGKNILIRGGGWSPDMMLRENLQRVREEFAYVQDMGLNTIRLEGKLETKEFLDLADERGILLIAGWCCCDHWEHWPNWKAQDFTIAEQSLRDQIYRLRGHPSLVAWMNGSDNPPPPDVEQTYLKVERELLWPNPVVSSATAKLAGFSGESGVKMTGPYEYVAPSYWQTDTTDSARQCNQGGCGGAYGFNTETSMGPAVPPIESIRAMVGKDHLWPIDDVWNYHAGGGAFKDLHVFTDALNARFSPAANAEDYALKSQLQTYEGVRAMYEAYSRNKYVSTGVIQWMLNNAWPSMIWHLYDFYLRPGGGYFGAKKAMESLHPVYGYDDHSIWVVSSQYTDAKGLTLTTKVLNLDMSEKYSQQTLLDASADSTSKILTLPDIDGLSPTYFLVLRLQDSGGKLVGTNFYWLSTKPETLDWEKSNWYTTPTASYADYTALAQLPKVRLKVAHHTERKSEDAITHVTLENPSQSLAFFVRLKVNKGKGGDEILPVLWQDNYFSLLPGEKREVTATYRAQALGATQAAVEVSGWNVE
jgi:exo-1,4-beta-D-glucosaminidase